ncbi:hypothetical protein [Paraburkholderia sp. BCC1885]|uniref:hypothetical protein n=1 Tax=Paraburkholderia sp. BCC1885 TaxID=2562669 RepID=UPI001642998C|nr:hypothetical protein [Paraburkholderia sp. BCC1885]
MLFLIHAACGFWCGVLAMHLLRIGGDLRRGLARESSEKYPGMAMVPTDAARRGSIVSEPYTSFFIFRFSDQKADIRDGRSEFIYAEHAAVTE